ncbi:platelet-activating factor receptor [Gouania willdenowi]|uniref:Platelet-activating factor receptor n=1 Tax=Gouania willdenowi TaxID=441366 RepID=A0A8C5NEI2_GOUWI|nr:platelet-activating factor receptor [Gouania willdenowi]
METFPKTEQISTTPSPDPVLTTTNVSSFLDSEFRYVLFPIVYSLVFILGFFANLYVLFVLRCLRQAKAMGEIRIYMTNLTIADLLFVSALPFWIGYYSRHGDWVYGDFMCRLTGSFFFINTYGTILFLAAISLNRYWAVTRPLDMASSDHRRRGIVVCVVIWLFTLSMSIPYLATPATNSDSPSSNVTRCFEGYQEETNFQKRTVAITHFIIIGLFLVIFLLVVVCNFLIARELLSQNLPESGLGSVAHESRKCNGSGKRRRGPKRRALQMLWAVVGVFVLCFTPHHVLQGFWTLAVLRITEGWGHVDWGQDTRQILNDLHQITLALMGLNCILDPVIYFFATTKFRRFITAHMKKLARGEGCSQTLTSQVSRDSRNQSMRLQSERH